jgi:NAD(P)-dependent dehydrogenase (short-subunit alcohol dehydrogenase family)
MRLKDKVIIVTGGANGIGRIYCENLCREGAQVLIADIDVDSAASLAKELNRQVGDQRAVAVRVDVTSEADTQEMVRTAINSFRRIDVLVNNAGTYPHVEFEKISYEDWRRVITINLDSVFLCSKAALPRMKEQGSGKIINIATNLVWTGLAGMVHYISAKSGIVGFTRSLAREIGEYGITVNAIAPGAVIPDTRLSETARKRVDMIVSVQCIKREQRPEDLVGVLIFLASSDSDFISGQVYTVDGGLTNH